MVVGEIPEAADLLIVGGGPGGYVAAIRGAQLGREVVLVDRRGDTGVGGVCLHVGCIPSKALIEVASAAHTTTSSAHMGLQGNCSVDLAAWQTWRSRVVDDLTGGVRALLRAAGVTIVAGDLRFTRPNQAVVETTAGTTRFYEFSDVIIATGSRPTELGALRRDGVQVLDSTDLLALRAVPASLVVVGAGYSGVELATAMAKLGAEVTIVEVSDRILPTMDPSLVKPVLSRLRQLGVTVMTSAVAEGYDAGAVRVKVGTHLQHIKADKVLVTVGRTPNTDQLGLDRLGVTPDARGLIAVQTDRRVSAHVAAIGDITEGPALAHKASAEALVAAEALSGHRVAFTPKAIPTVVFTDPEIASTGLNERQARAVGVDPIVARFPLSASGRAQTMTTTQGHIEIVADRATQAVVGVHAVGPHASDLISEGTLAVEMGATLEDLAATIHPHPTLSEQYPEAAHLALGVPIHLPARPRGHLDSPISTPTMHS
ncbi:dihydrolipoyl dehydrogenase [Dactylosporangium sp. NPDC051484]|uniref:dihydrolipoyl dehydrogenase n=1 Tax=Dactylosporangium sp. NPDC051484 TaxID=3154942 RepID=UPI00344F342D